MSPETTNQVLQFVRVSSALTKRALDELIVRRQAEKQASDIRSQIVQALIETGTVGAHQKEAAERMLTSHVETMKLLKNAAVKIAELGKNTKAASGLGHGVEEKTASDSSAVDPSLTSAYVGARTTEKKASDRVIMRRLGLGA